VLVAADDCVLFMQGVPELADAVAKVAASAGPRISRSSRRIELFARPRDPARWPGWDFWGDGAQAPLAEAAE
jgi:hypothetical protein